MNGKITFFFLYLNTLLLIATQMGTGMYFEQYPFTAVNMSNR